METNVVKDNVNYYYFDEFYIVGDNSTEKSGIDDDSIENITIYDQINGKSVQEIGAKAFYQCQQLKRVIINAKIRSINRYAFMFCSNLEYINIPSTVTFIGEASLCLNNMNVEDTEHQTINKVDTGRTDNNNLI